MESLFDSLSTLELGSRLPNVNIARNVCFPRHLQFSGTTIFTKSSGTEYLERLKIIPSDTGIVS
jgi:hypothetical protein